MRGARRGFILPVVLAAIVALGLLAGLALFDSVQEWRVAALADDQAIARAALLEGVDAVARPPALATLCVSPPLAMQAGEGSAAGGGRWQVRWGHVGEGLVRAEVTGRGPAGSASRALALVVPDTVVRVSGLLQCASATRLVPAGAAWIEAHPDGG